MTHDQQEKRAIAETLFNNTDAYRDIMRLPHHRSTAHPAMTNAERAAQFAPFAALTGYNDLIAESGEQLAQQSRLPFEEAHLLRRRLRQVRAQLVTRPRVKLTYFEGETGESHTVLGRVTALDAVAHTVTLDAQRVFPVANLQAVTLLPTT
ncbi:hypothetical protein [Levilactobacillus namurensis]|uniref:hypothetical protein n=1 Tax=Levilactobacillus namurensis TaxID=380393 RepID=UPI000464CD1D|nr:hypothetical protein [Levilactobacillus namurensis]